MPPVRRLLGSSASCRGLALAVFAWASLGAVAAEVVAADAARIAGERAAIQAERDRLEAQFAAEQARCAERFAVTACLDEVRDRRRAALQAPRARALALDDAERRARAAARSLAVARKQREAAERPVPAGDAASSPKAPLPGPPPAGARTLDTAASRQAAATAAASATEAAAARRADAARARQAAASAEQARIAARIAERARQGKSAAPLPVPASAPRLKAPAAPDSAAR